MDAHFEAEIFTSSYFILINEICRDMMRLKSIPLFWMFCDISPLSSHSPSTFVAIVSLSASSFNSEWCSANSGCSDLILEPLSCNNLSSLSPSFCFDETRDISLILFWFSTKVGLLFSAIRCLLCLLRCFLGVSFCDLLPLLELELPATLPGLLCVDDCFSFPWSKEAASP